MIIQRIFSKKKEEESDEGKKKKIEDKKATLKNAKVAGTAGILTGASALGLSDAAVPLAKKYVAKKTEEELAKKLVGRASKKMVERVAKDPKVIGTLRGFGLGLAGTGAGLVGASIYASKKLNKKDKEKKDDSAKK